MPSASPRAGLVNTSSEGMLGLNGIPESVRSSPAANSPSRSSPTRRSVPFEL